LKAKKITFSNSEIEVNAKIIVLADGALSPVSKMAGFSDSRILLPLLEFEVEVSPEDFERLSTMVRFDIGAAPYGYGWSFPKKNHLSIGVGTFKTKAKLKLKDYVEEYIKLLGIKKVISQSEHGFVVPLNPRSEIVKTIAF
jgi:Dehydrogenases (flavoproteins)